MLLLSDILEALSSTPVMIGHLFVKMVAFVLVAEHSMPLLRHNSGTADRYRWRAMHSVSAAAVIQLWLLDCWQHYEGVESCSVESSTVESVSVPEFDCSKRPIRNLLCRALADSRTASWQRKRLAALFGDLHPCSWRDRIWTQSPPVTTGFYGRLVESQK